jgi:hypothetical protein
MSDEPITDAPRSADQQDTPAQERPAQDADYRPSEAEGADDDIDDDE